MIGYIGHMLLHEQLQCWNCILWLVNVIVVEYSLSVGNPRDHLIQNANFVYEKPSIQCKIFQNNSRYT